MNDSPLHGMKGMTPGHNGATGIGHTPGCDLGDQFAVPVRETAPPDDQGAPPPAKPKRSLYILCIDDDEQVLEFMKDCLAHFTHEVRVASGGKYGIELFRTAILKSQPYDVVVTDLGMPDINGHQVARTIKSESPNTPVIMMTGWGANTRDDGDTTPGVDVVVSKPPRMAELNDLLLRMARLA